ncbi:MAG: cupredoxin domain-containing protein [Actinobacteria bacterium]|nr:cupredoxin domain-containing protein [Actinomycetota bacterium]
MLVIRNAVGAAAAASCALALGACGGSDTIAGAPTVNVGINDIGCTPPVLRLPAGPKNFVIKSSSTGKVTEYEILDGKRVIAEREGLTPGVERRFSIELKAGEYTSYCPGGTRERGKIIVLPAGGTGEGGTPSP